jgi:DNA polymerase III delta prime subunit
MFETGYKFVILDEVDYMTKNAQQALKNLLQNCNDNVRFCLICNYICKIDESLKNEFICIRFNQLPEKEIVGFVRNIATKENLDISDQTICNIQKMFQSDVRSMVNFLQLHQDHNAWELHVINDVIWEELYSLFTSNSSDETMIIQWILNITNYSGNMDIKTCIRKFFHFIITNHSEKVNSNILNIAETLLHPTDTNEYMLPYFVSQLKNQLIL